VKDPQTDFRKLVYDRTLARLTGLGGRPGVHIESAITALGGFAATAILRAAALPGLAGLAPGTTVLSDEVDRLGPMLLLALAGVCEKFGIPPSGGWDADVPDEHKPLADVHELVRRVAPELWPAADASGLGPRDLPLHFGIVGVQIVAQGKQILDATVGKALLATAIVAGSKTVPLPYTAEMPG
jgi:hypothetical protein